jgi:hypothetical protein
LGRARNAANLIPFEKQFTDDEDEFILAKVEQSERHWTRAVPLLEGHSANPVKNRSMMLTRMKQTEEFRQSMSSHLGLTARFQSSDPSFE